MDNTVYPRTKTDREERRQAIRRRAIDAAERSSASLGRSFKCDPDTVYNGFLGPSHAGAPNGCRNDGRNCLCECHDQSEQEVS